MRKQTADWELLSWKLAVTSVPCSPLRPALQPPNPLELDQASQANLSDMGPLLGPA